MIPNLGSELFWWTLINFNLQTTLIRPDLILST